MVIVREAKASSLPPSRVDATATETKIASQQSCFQTGLCLWLRLDIVIAYDREREAETYAVLEIMQ